MLGLVAGFAAATLAATTAAEPLAGRQVLTKL
jgi:hypothetical protein